MCFTLHPHLGQTYYQVPPYLQPTAVMQIPVEYLAVTKTIKPGGRPQPQAFIDRGQPHLFENLSPTSGPLNPGLAAGCSSMQPGLTFTTVGMNNVLGQRFLNEFDCRPAGKKSGNVYLFKTYNCDESVGNQDRMQKKFKDCRNQMDIGKDMATVCSPPKRRKMKPASISCKVQNTRTNLF